MPRLETLHVAALPYPTSQGTQAAIGLMIDALMRAGRRTALLTYASRAGEETRFKHITPRGIVRPRSLRSGPSLGKIAADLELAFELRRRAREADVVVAHHVEAAALAHALRLPRWIFVAHTALGPELPTYLPRVLSPLASRAGRALDGGLASVAPGVAAISPDVARALEALACREVSVLPVPIEPIANVWAHDDARAALGIASDDRVVLYAGNLDRYQGLPVLVDAMTELRATHERVRLLVASQSDTRELAASLARRSVRAYITSLADERDRSLAHAAADVAVVTRGTPGGFPIKLLDAVARGVPVVAMRRALSGASFPGVRIVDDDALALARGLRAALAAVTPDVESTLARDHLAHHHAPGAFVRALDRVIERTRGASDRRCGT